MLFNIGLLLVCIAIVVFVIWGLPLWLNSAGKLQEAMLTKAAKQADTLFLEKDPKRLLRISGLAGVFLLVLIMLLTRNWILALLCAGLVFAFPLWRLRFERIKRKELFNAQLPEIIEKMSNALRAGQGLKAAFEEAAQRSGGPFLQEAQHWQKEMALGLSMEEALARMATRTQSEDMTILVTALSLAQKTGGNISEVLDNISASIRDRRSLNGKIKALTSQGKMQGLIIGLLPLVLMIGIYLIDRNMILPLFQTGLGKLLLAAGLVLELLGVFFIRKVVSVRF